MSAVNPVMTPLCLRRRTRSAAAFAVRPTAAPRSRHDIRPSSRRSLRISLSVESIVALSAVFHRWSLWIAQCGRYLSGMHALTIGFGLGFLVAMQLGPMSLFLIRSTLRGGWAVGLSIGAGIAVIDALYAAAGA